MQHFLKVPFFRKRMYARAVEQFLRDQAAHGVILRNEDIPERMCALRTVMIDESLVMEGNDAVRMVAAPLEICDLARLKQQGAWMVLTAGISLGCDGYAPLENFARRMNFAQEKMARQYPRVYLFGYDDARQVETTVHRDGEGFRSFTKGAPEAVLARCSGVLNGRERPLAQEDAARALRSARAMERRGLRTLAFATRWQAEPPQDASACEADMVFLGVLGMGDLPSPQSPEAMDVLRVAGLRPVLASTGQLTPGAVEASGVLRAPAGVMDAAEMDSLDDETLRQAVQHADAYLEMDWRRRARLAKALRSEGLTATLTKDAETGALVLAFGGGGTPDVLIHYGNTDMVARLATDCRALVEAHTPS